MKPYYHTKYVSLYHGNCREVIRELDRTFSAIVTDPPYGIKFMGREWDHGVPSSLTWTRLVRYLVPGAPLLVFGGTRTFHRLAVNLEDAGLDIRDCLCWLYGSGFPKSLDISKALDKKAGARRPVVRMRRDGVGNTQRSIHKTEGLARSRSTVYAETAAATELAKLWQGYGTALKPAWEPILLALNPPEGTFADNVHRHGVGGLNIDGTRVGSGPSPAAKRRASSTAPVDPGSYEKERRGQMTNRMTPERYRETRPGEQLGRWPANLLLDEKAAEVLDGQVPRSGSTSKRAGAARHRTGYRYDMRGPANAPDSYGDVGGPSRFFYIAKASRRERGPFNKHPTVKPVTLMRYLLKLVTLPEANRVLDPFAGSGSTLVAAEALRLPCIGIEIDEETCETAARRLQRLKA